MSNEKFGDVHETVRVSDLNLGDVVQLFESAYGFATIRETKENGDRRAYRPHVVCGDFSYTGGVLVSIGVEDFWLYGGTEVTRVFRARPLR